MSEQTPVPAKSQEQQVFIVATAGHVDHGKSTLVRQLTGVDTDTLREEKQRGLTINLGFAYSHHDLGSEDSSRPCILGFVDVPGHHDFIHNMLAGVSAIDAALLVVAADDGIMPQTREHLQILDLLQLANAVVVISKTDTCDAGRVEKVRNDIQTLLADTGLHDAPIRTTAPDDRKSIEDLQDILLDLATSKPVQNSRQRLFRYQIDRSFTVKGIGTVVTGAAVAGQCQPDTLLCHSQSGAEVRVRGMRLDTQSLDRLDAGQRAALNVTGLGAESIKRGSWLCDPWLYHPVHRVDVSLRWLDATLPLPGAQYHLHLGAAHHLVTLRSLDPDRQQWLQICSQEPMHCHWGDRFIIRDPTGQQTLGGGRVIDIFVPRRHRSSPARLAQLEAQNQNDEQALLALLTQEERGVDLIGFRRNRNLSEGDLECCLQYCRQQQLQLFRLQQQQIDHGFAKPHFEQLSRQLLRATGEHHKANPSSSGITETGLARSITYDGPFGLCKVIIAKLVELQLLERVGSALRLPGHEAAESSEEKLFNNTLEPLLKNAGKIPPRTRELVDQTGISLQKMEQVLKQCVRTGRLIRVADNRHYLPETIAELAAFTEKLADDDTEGEGFTVIQFRDASGIGRNLCIEILEYFDQIGFTRRDGNSRYLRTSKDSFFS